MRITTVLTFQLTCILLTLFLLSVLVHTSGRHVPTSCHFPGAERTAYTVDIVVGPACLLLQNDAVVRLWFPAGSASQLEGFHTTRSPFVVRLALGVLSAGDEACLARRWHQPPGATCSHPFDSVETRVA